MRILRWALPRFFKATSTLLSYINSLYLTNESDVTLEELPRLLQCCSDSITFLVNEKERSSKKRNEVIEDLLAKFKDIISVLKILGPMVEEVRSDAPSYDLPGSSPGNGYRTFVSIADRAAATAYRIVKDCPNKMSAWNSGYCKQVAELSVLLTSLCTGFEYLLKLKSRSVDGSLYPKQEDVNLQMEEILDLAKKVDQECFYGSFIANQFDESLKFVMKWISLSMVCYSEIYYGAPLWRIGPRIAQYVTDDAVRGKRHVSLTHHAGVDFIKAFWRQSENPVLMVPMLITNPIAVSEELILAQESVEVDGVEVKPSCLEVSVVRGRLISKHVREGMPVESKGDGVMEKSRGLIVHVHGGGFVSQSARSQEVFLRKWAHSLDVPLFSIDYSLAPAAPFPRAVQEVFYGYCMALAKAHKLGTTAERVVFVGDSAGANLILAAVQLFIHRRVRLPDGIFLAYVPVLVSFVPSPARLLGMLDPLLPFGVMMRCAKAYIQGESSLEPHPSISKCACTDCKKTRQLTFLDSPHLDFNPDIFNVLFPADPLMSPYEAEDQVLRKMPPISLCSSSFDPCLDDTIMFAKRLQRLGNQVKLDVAEGLPHGFLNFCWVNEKTREATELCGQRISSLLNLSSLS